MDEVISLLERALRLLRDANTSATPVYDEAFQVSRLAWGSKVSSTFRDRVRWIGQTLNVNPDYLMACMRGSLLTRLEQT